MTKIITFKKRKDFLRVAKGEFIATSNIVIQATLSLSETKDIQVGYTATKKVGKAVIRNKCKRRMRAIARDLLAEKGLPEYDYIFIARQGTPTCNFKELKKDTNYAIKKVHLKLFNKYNAEQNEEVNS